MRVTAFLLLTMREKCYTIYCETQFNQSQNDLLRN